MKKLLNAAFNIGMLIIGATVLTLAINTYHPILYILMVYAVFYSWYLLGKQVSRCN